MAVAPVVPLSVLFGVAGVGVIALSISRHRIASLRHRFLRWQDRQRQRAALLDLDARLLRDVGLSREQAEREGRSRD